MSAMFVVHNIRMCVCVCVVILMSMFTVESIVSTFNFEKPDILIFRDSLSSSRAKTNFEH